MTMLQTMNKLAAEFAQLTPWREYIGRVELQATRWLPDGEIFAVNLAAGGHAWPLSDFLPPGAPQLRIICAPPTLESARQLLRANGIASDAEVAAALYWFVLDRAEARKPSTKEP